MSLPMTNPHAAAAPAQARFTHENGTHLRLQCFVVPRDAKGRIATLRCEGYEGWMLPGESMLLNESPDQAAVRTAKSYFLTPLGMQLDRILSFPAMGNGDDRWYLLFIYHAEVDPATLKCTPDTQEIVFRAWDQPPPQFAMSHADVWPHLK